MENLISSTKLVNPQLVSPVNLLGVGQYGTRLISVLITFAFIICVVAFLFMLLWGGFEWVVSSGTKEKLEDARARITNALVGLFILFTLFVVVRLTNTVFGVNFAGWGVLTGREPAPGSVNSVCSKSSDCDTGFCSTGIDSDGDGFLAEGSGRCNSSVFDCNDANNLVFPGQTKYFEDPITGTAGNYNYDCADGDGNGDVNDKWPRLNCLSAVPHSFACQLTPINESIIRPLTGWRSFVPGCGTALIQGGNDFWMCTASETLTCAASPGVVGQFGCFTSCLTGHNCGPSEVGLCRSWNVSWWTPFSSYFSADFPGGLSKMPCK